MLGIQFKSFGRPTEVAQHRGQRGDHDGHAEDVDELHRAQCDHAPAPPLDHSKDLPTAAGIYDALRGLLVGTPSHLRLDAGVLVLAAVAGITAASALLPRLAR